MGIVGADVPALRGLVSALTGRAHQIETTKSELSALIRSLDWIGPDREAFVGDWENIHQPNLIRLIDDMKDASRTATRHADAQENASHG